MGHETGLLYVGIGLEEKVILRALGGFKYSKIINLYFKFINKLNGAWRFFYEETFQPVVR